MPIYGGVRQAENFLGICSAPAGPDTAVAVPSTGTPWLPSTGSQVLPVSTPGGWQGTKTTGTDKVGWFMYNPRFGAAYPYSLSGLPTKKAVTSVWAEVSFAANQTVSGLLYFSMITLDGTGAFARRYNYEVPSAIFTAGCSYLIHALDVTKTTALGTSYGTTFQASISAGRGNAGLKAPIMVADDHLLVGCSPTRVAIPGATPGTWSAVNSTVPIIPPSGSELERVVSIGIETASNFVNFSMTVRKCGFSLEDQEQTVYLLQ